MSVDLLVIGASVRAAAFSALRAGLRPWCADLFADADLQARCPAIRMLSAEYPEGLSRVLRNAPRAPWIYTGALENQPGLVSKLAKTRPLWGNDAAALRTVRSPLRIHDILRSEGIPHPEIRLKADPILTQGRWLVKLKHGAGGAGIRSWLPNLKANARSKPVYFQEYIEGEPCAAAYVADGQKAHLLGMTRQLVGERWLHAGPFAYCGSIGPLPFRHASQAALQRLGDALTRGCGLRGLFGVDCILVGGIPWPVEINPRYTASIEVLEYATGISAIAAHRNMFTSGPAQPEPVSSAISGSVLGKAILFAKKAVTFPSRGPWLTTLQSPSPIHELPAFADIPQVGERLQAGRPILTFFVRGDSEDDCLDCLRQTAADLDQCLFGR